MSLKPQPPRPMPEDIATIGAKLLPLHSPYRLVGDQLYAQYNEADYADLYHLSAEMPAGVYRLLTGLYDATGQHVAATGPDGQQLADDQIELGCVTMARLDKRNYIPLALGHAAKGDSEEHRWNKNSA